MPYDVIIIGGGLAGLSAGVELSEQGARVLLLEQKPHLGGRTYSFRDRKTGDVVDNGQHLLMGCYSATRTYLRQIQSSHLATLQKNLHIDFIHARKGTASLDCLPLPAPWHVLSGLLRLKTLSVWDRLRLLRIGMELLASSNPKEAELASLTVNEWLVRCGQSADARKYLWDIIAIGSLNDDPARVSALLFYRVLKTSFLGARENASLLVPRVGLSELLVNPAVDFIRGHGGTIRTGVNVTGFEAGKKGITSVICGRKKETAGTYVSAVPYFALASMLPDSWKKEHAGLVNLGKFRSSPIITLHVWFDRSVMDREFTAVLDSTVQWIFNKSAMFAAGGRHQYLSLVISAASKLVNLSKEQLIRIALRDLRSLLPEARKANLVHSLVIKEKRATFSPEPSMLRYRPKTSVGAENFFLAGDWTDTGFPATIEGAVISGQSAAKEIRGSLR